jgi:hypothetical protein
VNHITVAGVGGTVRWGYAVAATLGAWTIDTGLFSADVVTVDTFRIAQSGLVLELSAPDGRPPASRRLVEVRVVDAGRRLSARLGPKG